MSTKYVWTIKNANSPYRLPRSYYTNAALVAHGFFKFISIGVATKHRQNVCKGNQYFEFTCLLAVP